MILIKKFNLLDFGLSGVTTHVCRRIDYVINLSKESKTPKFFQVSGGRMPYKTSNGKAYARSL